MSTQVTNYKCPACTGPLRFVGSSGKLECEYCENSYDVKEIESMYADKEAEVISTQTEAENNGKDFWNITTEGREWDENDKKMKAYECPSCGAQLICEETIAVTSCPYCGNSTVMLGQFSGTLRPDCVLPFKLSKEDAKVALKKHYRGKILLPKAFTAEKHIDEMKGIYVPFWLFDGEVDVDVTYYAAKSKTYREKDYRVTDTAHYEVHRAGIIAFENVPVDGSSKMPDDLMDSIEPYDYKDLTDFSTAYLPGYLADKYDVDAQDAAQRADKRCKNTAVSAVRSTVKGYEEVHTHSQHVTLQRGKVQYALLPVWILSTRWNGKNFLFAMNGQTGKMVGDLPVDKNKLRKWFWGVAVGTSVVLSFLFSQPLGRIIAAWLT